MPQKIDALAEAIEKKDYSLIEKILTISNDFQATLREQAIIPNYKLNLEKLSSKKERLLCKAVINNDCKACSLLLQYGADIRGTQASSYTVRTWQSSNYSSGYPSGYYVNNVYEKTPSALAYAMRDADLYLVKLLLMNDNEVSIDNLTRALSLEEWDQDNQTKIKNRPEYNQIIKNITCFKILKTGLSSYQSKEERYTQDAQALAAFMQALTADHEFTLECLEAFIKELNCISQGLLADTRLTQFDTSADLASLHVLIQASTCFFTIAHMHNTVSKEIFIRLDQALMDLLALQQNLKQSDELKQKRPFPSDEAAREFVLFNIKDTQYKATIQAMNHPPEKKINKPTVSQTDSVDSPKTFFFAPSTSSTDTALTAPSSESQPIIEEKPPQPSPFP